MKINQVYRCNKKHGNRGAKCGSIATNLSNLESINTKKISTAYRCESHRYTKTSDKRVINTILINQTNNINNITTYLKQFINQPFFSKFHNKTLTGRYLHKNLSIMCIDNKNKWKLVYYEQIEDLSSISNIL